MPIKIRPPKDKGALVQKVRDRYSHFVTWVRARRKPLLAVLVLMVIVNGGIAGAVYFTRSSEEKAWMLELAAFQLLHEDRSDSKDQEKDEVKEAKYQERLTEAAKKYETLLEQYPNRPAAVLALYELGNIYFEQEKYDLAEKRYLEFIKKHPSHPLLSSVHLKLGYLYSQKKDLQAALHPLRQAYDGIKEGLNQDQAGFELARVLEQTDKKEEAIDIYKKISTAFSESPWGMEAKARLALLAPQSATSTDANASSSHLMTDSASTSSPIPSESVVASTTATP